MEEGEGRLGRGVRSLLSTSLGAAGFGIAFVLIAIGRSELFTENVLIPVAAVWERRGTPAALARTWSVTFVGNLVGLVALAAVLSGAGVLSENALQAAGHVSDVYASRDFVSAFS